MYRVKFTFFDSGYGVPLVVYELERKHFRSKNQAWHLINAAFEKFDYDDLDNLFRIVVYKEF